MSKSGKLFYTIISLVPCVLILTCTKVNWEDPFTGGNELVVPIVGLIGPDPYYLYVNDKYNEFGAVAFDTTNGDSTDITEKIVIVINNVDDSIPTDSPGEHIVKYYATNDNSITGKAERRVIVREITGPDTVKPVITIIGSNPRILFVGGTYIEEGATAYDSVDGDLTDSIKTYGDSISTDNPDSFEVFYEVEDKAGNMAREKRDVYVWEGGDTIPPVITLLGDAIMNVCAGGVFIDSGATATDDVDGDISYKIIDSGSVNMQKLGSYYIYYNVSDFAGNAAEEKIRTVNVVDTMGPTVTINPPNPVNLMIDNQYIEWGATAHDNLDGDITHKLDTVGYVNVNTNDSVDVSKPGVYRVHYRVQDSVGYTTDSVRIVNVLDVDDTIPPVITLLGNNPMLFDIGEPYNEPGATATDNKDGDITDQIVINSDSVNTSVEGTYRVHYTVSDSSGNTAHEIRALFVGVDPDSIPPVITLLGDNPMTIEINDPYTEPGATAIDDVDGDISSKIVITGTVDNTKVGTYTRTYNVSDNAGNKATSKERTVKVVEQITPDWEPWVDYSIGDLVTYNGQVYRCIQAHPSQPGWEPPNAPALWQPQK